MNPTEQRTHRTVTQSLEQRIEALETVVVQLGRNDEWLKREIERVDLRIEERRSQILNEVGAAIGAHLHRSFFGRLRWILVGNR